MIMIDMASPYLAPHNVPAKEFTCEAAPAPVVALATQSKYGPGKGGSRSKVNDYADKLRAQQLEPLEKFTKAVIKAANAYAHSQPADASAAACVISRLKTWAEAGALTQMQTDDAENTLATRLAAIAASYLEVRSDAVIPAAEKQVIERWLGQLGRNQRNYFERLDEDSRTKNNNHRAWGGVAVALSGIASGDRELLDWGLRSGRKLVNDLDDDGTAPRELERDKKAAFYHNYLMLPLSMLARLAALYDQDDFYRINDGALKKLGELLERSIEEPDPIFEEKTDKEQETLIDDSKPEGSACSRLSWLVLYPYANTQPPEACKEGYHNTALGGDMDLVRKQR